MRKRDKQKARQYYENKMKNMTPEQKQLHIQRKMESNKRYIDRLKERMTPEQYEAYKARKNEANKRYYARRKETQTPEEREIELAKKREQNKRYMARLKERLTPEEYEVLKAKRRLQSRKYREKISPELKEHYRMYRKHWYIRNAEHCITEARKRYAKYYADENNRKKILERQKLWRQQNLEAVRRRERLREKKKREAGTQSPQPENTNSVRQDIHTVYLKYGIY